MSELNEAIADLRSRIVRLEEHASTGLIDRGELRRETAVLHEQVDNLEQIARDHESNHVTRTEFSPVKLAVYGVIGLMLSAVVTALVALVVRP